MDTAFPTSEDVRLCVTVAEAQLVRIFDSLKPNQDVFVQLVCGYEDGTEKVVGKTEVCYRGNFHPKWNDDFLIDRDPSQGSRTIKFRVHIDHIWRNPVLCGEAEFAVDNLWTKAKSGPQRVVVPLFKRGSERTGILKISVAMQRGVAPGLGGRCSTPNYTDLARHANAAAVVAGTAMSAATPPPFPAPRAAMSAATSPAVAQHGVGRDLGHLGPLQPPSVKRTFTHPVEHKPAVSEHGAGGDTGRLGPSQQVHVPRSCTHPVERKPIAANRVPPPPVLQQDCAGGTVLVPQPSQQQQMQRQGQRQQQWQQQTPPQQLGNVLRPDSKSEDLPQFTYPAPPALLAAQHAIESGMCGGMPCGTAAGPRTMVPSATSCGYPYATGLSGQWWNSFINRG